MKRGIKARNKDTQDLPDGSKAGNINRPRGIIVIMFILAMAGIFLMLLQNNTFTKQQRVISSAISDYYERVEDLADSVVIESKKEVTIKGKKEIVSSYVIRDSKILESIKTEASAIKSSIEIQSNTIQSQYTLLSIWTTVMTIMFLLYAFYSLYKTDDLVDKSQSCLRDIRDIDEDIAERSKTINNKIDEMDTTVENKIKQKIDEKKDEIEKLGESTIVKLNGIKEDCSNSFQSSAERIKVYADLLEEIKALLNKEQEDERNQEYSSPKIPSAPSASVSDANHNSESSSDDKPKDDAIDTLIEKTSVESVSPHVISEETKVEDGSSDEFKEIKE